MLFFSIKTACDLVGHQIILPALANDYIHYQISADCMRFDICAEINIPLVNITKSFAAFVELDPCQFMIRAAFEKKTKTIYIFDYDWGKSIIACTFSVNYCKTLSVREADISQFLFKSCNFI